MRPLFTTLPSDKRYLPITLIILFTAFYSCRKAAEPEIPIESPKNLTIYSYEVECDYCNISFTDETNQTKTVKNNVGKWNYKIDRKISFELKLSIETILPSYQVIQAYILKDGEAFYGNLGYNQAVIKYNTLLGSGSSTFGNYIPTGPSDGNSSGGTTKPASSLCGAKNKTGGYCKRTVVGGGRCWQHR